MKVGDVVKFTAPVTKDETLARYVVREMRGDRALVAIIDSHFAIIPTEVHPVTELTVVD